MNILNIIYGGEWETNYCQCCGPEYYYFFEAHITIGSHTQKLCEYYSYIEFSTEDVFKRILQQFNLNGIRRKKIKRKIYQMFDEVKVTYVK